MNSSELYSNFSGPRVIYLKLIVLWNGFLDLILYWFAFLHKCMLFLFVCFNQYRIVGLNICHSQNSNDISAWNFFISALQG